MIASPPVNELPLHERENIGLSLKRRSGA